MSTLEVHPTTDLRCSCGAPATTAIPSPHIPAAWMIEGWCGRQPAPDLIAEGREIVAELVSIADRLDLLEQRMENLDAEVSDSLGCNLGEHNDGAGLLIAHSVLFHLQETVTGILGGIGDDNDPTMSDARAFLAGWEVSR